MCIPLLLLLALPFPATAAPEENSGPNANLQRQANGRYAYRTVRDGRERGVEEFDMFVHRDGSRTLMIWRDLWAKNAQFSVVLRVAGPHSRADADGAIRPRIPAQQT